MLTYGITMGDAAGIGPEVVLKALNQKQVQGLAKFLIIGNSFVLDKSARLFKQRLSRKISILNVGKISKLVFGRAQPVYGQVALDCIRAALKLIKAGRIDALITAPVNKYAISLVQTKGLFRGHTEYLAQATKSRNFVMLLVGGPLKVALVTRHLALKEVPQALTKERIYQTIRLSTLALRRYFTVAHPRIGVCGLNPHAADAGIMGDEEAKIIHPAVIKARRVAGAGVSIQGPLPADSLFYSAARGKFDLVVAMYHDQGLIPLKTLSLHQGVNLTLGLPFVRTSPDHGTAYDIAGQNLAQPGSMIAAIKLAVEIGKRCS